MKITPFFFLLALSTNLFSQNPIQFINPSFEDAPQPSKVPRGWYNCGPVDESPPDVQPNNQFKVTKEPHHGRSYLGMVARDNETTEAIGQKLTAPLLADSTYTFDIHLAQSEQYVSLSRTTGKEINYIKPCILRIWGGNEYCDKSELLFRSDPINHSDWKLYNITFTPKSKYNFISFEVYYDTPILFAYNGNLLLDNIISGAPPLNSEIFIATEENLLAIDHIVEFWEYAKEERVFIFFEHNPIEHVEKVVNNFRTYDMNDSANTIEKLIAEWKVAFQGPDSSRKKLRLLKRVVKISMTF